VADTEGKAVVGHALPRLILDTGRGLAVQLRCRNVWIAGEHSNNREGFMSIKKVTITDLENIRGGVKPPPKINRAEKKATRQLTKEYNKNLKAKNARIEPVAPKGV
jgi:hypothetical protein